MKGTIVLKYKVSIDQCEAEQSNTIRRNWNRDSDNLRLFWDSLGYQSDKCNI